MVTDGETAVAIAIGHGDAGAHGVLTVRGRQGKNLTVDVEHKVAQNGEGILAVNHF